MRVDCLMHVYRRETIYLHSYGTSSVFGKLSNPVLEISRSWQYLDQSFFFSNSPTTLRFLNYSLWLLVVILSVSRISYVCHSVRYLQPVTKYTSLTTTLLYPQTTFCFFLYSPSKIQFFTPNNSDGCVKKCEVGEACGCLPLWPSCSFLIVVSTSRQSVRTRGECSSHHKHGRRWHDLLIVT